MGKAGAHISRNDQPTLSGRAARKDDQLRDGEGRTCRDIIAVGDRAQGLGVRRRGVLGEGDGVSPGADGGAGALVFHLPHHVNRLPRESGCRGVNARHHKVRQTRGVHRQDGDLAGNGAEVVAHDHIVITGLADEQVGQGQEGIGRAE